MNSRAKKIILLGFLVPALAVLAVLFFFDPERTPIYPVCMFHKWTGLNCPGCGSLRAMHALLHGRVFDALRLNPVLVVSLPLFAWWGWRMLKRRLKNEPQPPLRMSWLWAYVGVWVLFGIVRNLPVPLFAMLSP